MNKDLMFKVSVPLDDYLDELPEDYAPHDGKLIAWILSKYDYVEPVRYKNEREIAYPMIDSTDSHLLFLDERNNTAVLCEII